MRVRLKLNDDAGVQEFRQLAAWMRSQLMPSLPGRGSSLIAGQSTRKVREIIAVDATPVSGIVLPANAY